MNFIDSHTHLHDERIRDRFDLILERAEKSNIKYMASCATMERNFNRTLNLAQNHPSILPFFGIHPWFLDTMSEKWKQCLETALDSVPSGVGETGLDFVDKTMDRDRQLDVFQYHLDLAVQMKRPINIHIRKAWDTFMKILKRMGPLPVPGLVHSYSGSADTVRLLTKYNLYISYSGSVTNPGARKVVQAFSQTPLDRLVFETDTPDIYPYIENPDPSRLNEPSNLPGIVTIASGRIFTDVQKIADAAWENSLILFEPLLTQRNSS